MGDLSNVLLFPVRAAAWGMGAFGLLGLLLSAVGILGTLAYSVAQRGHEVGIRLALGARPEQVVRMVVAGGMRRVAAGMVIGLALAFGVAQLLQAVLVGDSPTDPTAFAVVSLLLAAVAGVASYIPARRAAKADPLVVLRHE
jgi:putative ABC transport system permease protein